MFEDVPPNPDFAALEAIVIEYWREMDIAAKARGKSKPGMPPFVFYEGPPTANGRPGIHHVSARAVKDTFCRFKTMLGHRVDRRAGWDTHGLPVEIEIEKEIGSRTKNDIENYGVENFNAKCRESVFRYIEDWMRLTDRMAFWLDFSRSYITYDNNYIESEWWILKNLWERGLLYQDYKTSMHCPRCNTSLADHEVSQGIADDVDDPSVWVKFRPFRDELVARGMIPAEETRPVSLLAWTTTPWTIAANAAIGVAADTPYAVVAAPPFWGAPTEAGQELYIVADSLVDSVFEAGRAERVRLVASDVLDGLPYTGPLLGQMQGEETPAFRRVLIDAAVEVSAGSGVLHIAPAYGDLDIGQRHGLPVVYSAGRDGVMLEDVRAPDAACPGPFVGTFFKTADREIIRDLKARGFLFRSDRVKHAYPFCWRDGTPLMFLAKTSWYIRTTAVKDQMVANNQAIRWVPSHVRDGRFGRWLENNIDWAISRERFWGCPLPVWVAEDGDLICIGSLAELEQLTGRDLADLDLHRPFIDAITFEKGGKVYSRVRDTVDVWFDSGAMPYCQWHYPFENREAFEHHFPGDFISEAMDQTRGWFYSLHAIAALLTYSGDETTPAGPLAGQWADSPAFRNVVVQGFINDADDKKMSKSRGNTVDPWGVFDKEGCDALRWYILGNAPAGKNLAFNRNEITKQSLRLFLILWNCYSFFVTYANLSAADPGDTGLLGDRPEFDRWLEAKRNLLIVDVTAALDSYDPTQAINLIEQFIDRDLSQWYLRGNRQRFWGRLEDAQAVSGFRALYDALMTVSLLMAPMAPFLTESMYLNLSRAMPGAAPSIHLADWPVAESEAIDSRLIEDMTLVMDVAHLGRSARVKSKIKVRQPLRVMHVRVRSEAERSVIEQHAELLLSELNVGSVVFADETEVRGLADFAVRPNFKTLSSRLGARLSALRALMAEKATQEQIVSALLAGQDVTLKVGETDELFTREDFLLDLTDKGGMAVALDGGLLVALETDLDEALIEEGRVREVLRHVQDARRRAGFQVSDRITLCLDGEGAAHFVAVHGERLAKALLAEKLTVGTLPQPEINDTLDLGTVTFSVTARKV